MSSRDHRQGETRGRGNSNSNWTRGPRGSGRNNNNWRRDRSENRPAESKCISYFYLPPSVTSYTLTILKFIASRSSHRGPGTSRRDTSAPNHHRNPLRANESDRPDSSNGYRNRNPNFQNQSNDAHNSRTKKPVRQMGFTMIKSLLENENLEDIVFQMNNDRKGFKELLENNEIKPDIIVLVIKLLGKICGCSFKNSIITIMETALRSSFADNAVIYISKLAIQVSTIFHTKNVETNIDFQNLIVFKPGLLVIPKKISII